MAHLVVFIAKKSTSGSPTWIFCYFIGKEGLCKLFDGI